MVSVGLNNNQTIFAQNIKVTKNGYKFKVIYNGENLGKFSINMLGKHNIKNALFAIAVAYLYKIKLSRIKKSLRKFKGVKRRYENLGKYRNKTIISDYAHHPTEIKNSIKGLRNKESGG